MTKIARELARTHTHTQLDAHPVHSHSLPPLGCRQLTVPSPSPPPPRGGILLTVRHTPLLCCTFGVDACAAFVVSSPTHTDPTPRRKSDFPLSPLPPPPPPHDPILCAASRSRTHCGGKYPSLPVAHPSHIGVLPIIIPAFWSNRHITRHLHRHAPPTSFDPSILKAHPKRKKRSQGTPMRVIALVCPPPLAPSHCLERGRVKNNRGHDTQTLNVARILWDTNHQTCPYPLPPPC
jgi:hypothetical protein